MRPGKDALNGEKHKTENRMPGLEQVLVTILSDSLCMRWRVMKFCAVGTEADRAELSADFGHSD